MMKLKKSYLWMLAIIIALSLSISACGSEDTTTDPDVQENTSEGSTNDQEEELTEEPDSDPESNTDDKQSEDQLDLLPSGTEFSLSDIAPYSGEPYAVVNNNIPYFTDDEITSTSFEDYSELDSLGRCGIANSCIGTDIMPTEKREGIGQVKPSGWKTVKYDIVSGKYLYNRCHLIGYQLAGENANEKNLITGTRYLNVDGMLPFENQVADYVKETDNHVLYRVTPVFEGDNLVANGVLMEAQSVEDQGEDIQFCVYCYNVQPGITIDYATGDSWLDDGSQPQPQSQSNEPSPSEDTPSKEANQQKEDESQEVAQEPVVPAEPEPQGTTYILNTNTKKFHLPSCYTIEQMKESNKQTYTGARDDVIAQGYDPCKKCNP